MNRRTGMSLVVTLLAGSLSLSGCVEDAPDASPNQSTTNDLPGDMGGDGGTADDAGAGGERRLSLTFHSEQTEERLYRWAPLQAQVFDDSGQEVTCDRLLLEPIEGGVQVDSDGAVVVTSESATIGGTCDGEELIEAIIETEPFSATFPEAWLLAHYRFENDDASRTTWFDAIGEAEWGRERAFSPTLRNGSVSEFPHLSFDGASSLLLREDWSFSSDELTITWYGSRSSEQQRAVWFATCFDGLNQQIYSGEGSLIAVTGAEGGAVTSIIGAAGAEPAARTVRFAVVDDILTLTGWYDGQMIGSAEAPISEINLRDIGGRCPEPAGNWLQGTVSEVLIHEAALSDDEVGKIHNYLETKYAPN